MDFLLKYSGLIVIFFAWVFLVFPYVVLCNSSKVKTISEAAVKSGVGKLINIGVIGASLFQILFAYYLIALLNSSLSFYGGLFFVLGSLAFLLAGFITVKKSRELHLNLVKSYFVLMAAGTFMLGLAFTKINFAGGYYRHCLLLLCFSEVWFCGIQKSILLQKYG